MGAVNTHKHTRAEVAEGWLAGELARTGQKRTGRTYICKTALEIFGVLQLKWEEKETICWFSYYADTFEEALLVLYSTYSLSISRPIQFISARIRTVTC